MQSDFWSNVGMLAALAISFSVLVGLVGRPLASVLRTLSRRLRRSPIGSLVPLTLVGALLAYGGTKPPPVPPDPPPPERDELRAGEALDERQATMFAEYAGFAAKGLPKGLKWNKKAGVLSGTPTAPGVYDVVFSKGSDRSVEVVTVGHYADPEIPIVEAYGPYSVGTVVCEELAAATGCKAKGLPTGLKFSAKALTDKTCGEVPAGALYGVPTKAGAYTVVFTRKIGNVTHTASATVVVAALAADVQGTFDGGSDDGQAMVTVAKNGKVGGTWLTAGKKYKIAAPAFAQWDAESGEYAALATFTAGKGDVFVTEIRMCEGKLSAGRADGEDPLFEAWQNQWKTVRKDEARLLKGWEPEPQPVEGGVLSFNVGANGTVKVTGEFVTGFDEKREKDVVYKASGSATLIPTESAGTYVLFVSLPPKKGKFDGYSGRVTLTGD